MKIDFYISSLSGGGAERVLCALANAMQRAGHEVAVVSLEKRPQFYAPEAGVEVVKIDHGQKKFGAIRDYFAVKKLLKTRKADLAVSFLARCNLLVLTAGWFSKQPIVVSDRNNPVMEHSEKVFRLQNFLYRRANAVVVQTEKIKALYDARLQDKIYVVENPLDEAGLQKQLVGKPLCKEREKTLLSVGRLERQKDFKTLLAAFANIHEKYPDWKVKIFGIGEMEEELKTLAKNLGLEDKALFCGRTETPFYEMRKASVFVLSSFYEGFPNVLCEAMAAGDLCIASDCVSGPSELIEEGKNGRLFPVGDVKKLTECLEAYMQNAETLQEIRNNAQTTVKRLSLDKITQKWLDIFENGKNV